MKSVFYQAGYDEALVKMGGWGSAIQKGVSAAGKWIGNLGAKMGPIAPAGVGKAAPTGWLAGKAQGAAQGLGQSISNLAAAPGQTLWQGAGNFGKNMLGMGNAATTSGVLGRGAMGAGLVGGAMSPFRQGPQPGPGKLPGPGQMQ
jgi:hypothetical protein